MTLMGTMNKIFACKVITKFYFANINVKYKKTLNSFHLCFKHDVLIKLHII